jgi:beta-lactam-binding protein with PASTA domain
MDFGIRRPIVVVVMLGQILAAGLICGKALGAETAASYRVPAVTGLSAKDAKAAPQAAGLVPRFQVGKPATSPNQSSTVYAVEPAPSTRLNKGAVVQVTLYAGAPTGVADTAKAGARPAGSPDRSARVPSVIGTSAREAKVAITAAGFVPRFQMGSATPSPAAALTAYAQLPQAGTMAPMGTAVTVTLYSRTGVDKRKKVSGTNGTRLSAKRDVRN